MPSPVMFGLAAVGLATIVAATGYVACRLWRRDVEPAIDPPADHWDDFYTYLNAYRRGVDAAYDTLAQADQMDDTL